MLKCLLAMEEESVVTTLTFSAIYVCCFMFASQKCNLAFFCAKGLSWLGTSEIWRLGQKLGSS